MTSTPSKIVFILLLLVLGNRFFSKESTFTGACGLRLSYTYSISPFLSLNIKGEAYKQIGTPGVKGKISLNFDFNRNISPSYPTFNKYALRDIIQMSNLDVLKTIDSIREAKIAIDISKKEKELLEQEEMHTTSKIRRLELLVEELSNLQSYFEALRQRNTSIFELKLWKGDFQQQLRL